MFSIPNSGTLQWLCPTGCRLCYTVLVIGAQAMSQLDKSATPQGTTMPSPQAVRAQVDRIVSSRHFLRSPRLSQFLRFVVEEALEGRGEQIKETVLAPRPSVVPTRTTRKSIPLFAFRPGIFAASWLNTTLSATTPSSSSFLWGPTFCCSGRPPCQKTRLHRWQLGSAGGRNWRPPPFYAWLPACLWPGGGLIAILFPTRYGKWNR